MEGRLLYRRGWDISVRTWLDTVPEEVRGKVLARINLLKIGGPALDYPYTSQIEGKLREARLRVGKTRYRILYFFDETARCPIAWFTKATQPSRKPTKKSGVPGWPRMKPNWPQRVVPGSKYGHRQRRRSANENRWMTISTSNSPIVRRQAYEEETKFSALVSSLPQRRRKVLHRPNSQKDRHEHASAQPHRTSTRKCEHAHPHRYARP